MAKLIKKKKRGKIQIELTVQEQDILASLLWRYVGGSPDGPRGVLTEQDGNLLALLSVAGANRYTVTSSSFIQVDWEDGHNE